MNSPPRAAPFLEYTLLASIIIHALAILAMLLCLLPGLPGGPTEDISARAAHVAVHPWLWRLGWIPWHLSALIDLVTAIALMRTPWIARLPAWLTLLVTLSAVIPEQ